MAETTPTEFKTSDGRAWFADPAVAAGMLALDGAAWDGDGRFTFPDDRDYAQTVSQRGTRVLRVELAGSRVEQLPVLQQTDYHDKATGKRYAAGEVAPVPRVFFNLVGRYEQAQGEARVRTRWADDDYRDWYRRWHTPGGAFVVRPQAFVECRNRLLDWMRDKHGIGKRRKMEVGND